MRSPAVKFPVILWSGTCGNTARVWGCTVRFRAVQTGALVGPSEWWVVEGGPNPYAAVHRAQDIFENPWTAGRASDPSRRARLRMHLRYRSVSWYPTLSPDGTLDLSRFDGVHLHDPRRRERCRT